jgi:hypothetical protein
MGGVVDPRIAPIDADSERVFFEKSAAICAIWCARRSLAGLVT